MEGSVCFCLCDASCAMSSAILRFGKWKLKRPMSDVLFLRWVELGPAV